MRVVSGTARGRRLKEPAGMDVRPTTDKVKESVFNIIQFDIEGRRVLDLFSGTGQMGIEALSRGASGAVFVDSSASSVRLTKENLRITGLDRSAEVVRSDSIQYLKSCGRFDIIFIDPPYDTDLLDRALDAIFQFDILKDNGIIICESKADKRLPQAAPPYRSKKEYGYGKIKITVFTREAGL